MAPMVLDLEIRLGRQTLLRSGLGMVMLLALVPHGLQIHKHVTSIIIGLVNKLLQTPFRSLLDPLWRMGVSKLAQTDNGRDRLGLPRSQKYLGVLPEIR